MRRIDVVVRAQLVAGLRLPPLAVTTGEATTEWVDVPVSRWRFARRPAQRLPEEWAALNPGVTLTDEPEPGRHSRIFYAAWSVALVAGGVALGVLIADDRREDPILLAIAVPAIVIVGLSTALKTLPRGYVRFEQPD